MFAKKLEVYWQRTGALKKSMSDSGLHTLPAMRGEFYRYRPEDYLPQEKKDADSLRMEPVWAPPPLLPLEDQTARVLESIYPRRLPSQAAEDGEKPVRPKKRGSDREFRKGDGHGSESEPPKSTTSAAPARPTSQNRLMQFRQKILDKFSTMSSAFEVFATDAGGNTRDLSRKEFHRFLSRHFAGLPKEEHDKIFEFLDHDRSGTLSLEEFHTAIEAAAPVKTIEDLRRKWIALGYSSMKQAMNIMDLFKDPGRQLTLQEFGTLLSKVGIEDEIEHQNIFNAIFDPFSKTPTVTLEMLCAAISAISPALLLEEVRGKVLKNFSSMSAAFSALDLDQGDSLDIGEFIRFAVPAFKMTSYEAAKVFRLIDVDNSRNVSKNEFLLALTLSEPNIYLDEVRRKVRSRFRSLHEVIQESAKEDQAAAEDGKSSRPSSRAEKTGEPDRRPATPAQQVAATRRMVKKQSSRFLEALETDVDINKAVMSHTPAEYQSILAKAQLSESDTQAIFNLMDFNRDGKMSTDEFQQGLHLFAPSVSLEALRNSCLWKFGSVAEAFASIPQEKREVNMDLQQLERVLQDLDIMNEEANINLQGVIDIVECHREGGVTIGELIAALQAGSTGTQVRLSPEQRDAKARQQVKWQMAPFHRSAIELRGQVREKLICDEERLEWWERRPDSKMKSGRARRNVESGRGGFTTTITALAALQDGDMDDPQWGLQQVSKESQTSQCVSYPPMRASYSKVSKHLRTLAKEENKSMLEKLHGYYANAGDHFSSNEGLLTVQQSRYKQFKSCSHHYTLLTRPPGGP